MTPTYFALGRGLEESTSRLQLGAVLCCLDIFKALSTSEVWLHEVAAHDSDHPAVAGYSEMAQLVQNWQAWLS